MTPLGAGRRRAAALVALVACGVLVTAGCGGGPDPAGRGPSPAAETQADDGPRPLNVEESQRLSLVRFSNFRTGVRAVRFDVADTGSHYGVTGWVDFTAGFGYTTVLEGRPGAETPFALVAWDAATISAHAPAGGTGAPPLPPPDVAADDPAWTSSPLSPDASRLHAAMATVLAAGNDRPDNPVLLQQTDARWLRADEVDGVPVDVLTGPTSDHVYDPASGAADDGSDATVRYWIDHDGLLRRMELRLGGGAEWTVVDFGDAPDVSFAETFRAAASAIS
ncbi:MAG TPA: hypothetical protein VIP77_04650 [Jiangellaceae bacterium]